MERGGQFQMDLGGQFAWIFQLGGKKKNFNKEYFDQFGAVLDLNAKQIHFIYKKLVEWLPAAIHLIDSSFLHQKNKQQYKTLIQQRVNLFEGR
jgi:serine/threonine-protein kinase HipA